MGYGVVLEAGAYGVSAAGHVQAGSEVPLVMRVPLASAAPGVELSEAADVEPRHACLGLVGACGILVMPILSTVKS